MVLVLVLLGVGGQEYEGPTVRPSTVAPPSRTSPEEILLSLCPPRPGPATHQPSPANLLVVSTLDGQLTALDLDRDGEMLWSTPTMPGPMLQSTLSGIWPCAVLSL